MISRLKADTGTFQEGFEQKEVPAALADIFSLKEITKMNEAEFDELIDQLDKDSDNGTLDDHLNPAAAPEAD